MAMTYRQMLKILLQATSDELDQNITVYDKQMDEFYPVVGEQVSGEQDDCPAGGVLDEGCLYLEFNGDE